MILASELYECLLYIDYAIYDKSNLQFVEARYYVCRPMLNSHRRPDVHRYARLKLGTVHTTRVHGSVYPALVTRVHFDVDSLRGLGLAWVPKDLRHRLYNTLALPCECVILVVIE